MSLLCVGSGPGLLAYSEATPLTKYMIWFDIQYISISVYHILYFKCQPSLWPDLFWWASIICLLKMSQIEKVKNKLLYLKIRWYFWKQVIQLALSFSVPVNLFFVTYSLRQCSSSKVKSNFWYLGDYQKSASNHRQRAVRAESTLWVLARLTTNDCSHTLITILALGVTQNVLVWQEICIFLSHNCAFAALDSHFPCMRNFYNALNLKTTMNNDLNYRIEWKISIRGQAIQRALVAKRYTNWFCRLRGICSELQRTSLLGSSGLTLVL